METAGVIINEYTKNVGSGNINATYGVLIAETTSMHITYTAENLKRPPIPIVESSNIVIEWVPGRLG